MDACYVLWAAILSATCCWATASDFQCAYFRPFDHEPARNALRYETLIRNCQAGNYSATERYCLRVVYTQRNNVIGRWCNARQAGYRGSDFDRGCNNITTGPLFTGIYCRCETTLCNMPQRGDPDFFEDDDGYSNTESPKERLRSDYDDSKVVEPPPPAKVEPPPPAKVEPPPPAKVEPPPPAKVEPPPPAKVKPPPAAKVKTPPAAKVKKPPVQAAKVKTPPSRDAMVKTPPGGDVMVEKPFSLDRDEDPDEPSAVGIGVIFRIDASAAARGRAAAWLLLGSAVAWLAAKFLEV